jgi:hypothetical protein
MGVLVYFRFLVGFIGFSYVGYVGFLGVSWVVFVYTTCVIRGVLRFCNKIFLLIKKK